MTDERLHLLAAEAGVAVDWIDANARAQRVSPEVLRKVLSGLGHPADSDSQVEASLASLAEQHDARHLPPLFTVDHGHALDLSLYFPPHTACRVHLEDGAQLDLHLDEQGRLPGLLPTGYQSVDIGKQGFTVAVAPPRCYGVDDANDQARSRLWGLSAQLYSLRRAGDGGFGDTLALEDLARSAAERGADALAISPMHAMFSIDPTRYSPYSPSSRLFINSLYASPAAILGERAVRVAIESAELSGTLQDLEALPLIDWPDAACARQKLLEVLYRQFITSEHPLATDFASFRHQGGEALENHCRYEALQEDREKHGQPSDWRRWPEAWRNPRGAEVQAFAALHAERIGFFAFCQWLAARSLERVQQGARGAGMKIGLIADLAVGADGAGSQAWSRQDELLANVTVGAPPDILNRDGQGWGISAFSPEGLKRNGFRAFIEMLRANFAHAGGLRIDHVMGLYRLWVIPMGSHPSEGAYLHYPFDDLLRLLALESQRHRAIVLGEDLGTVPDGLREKLAERGVLGMRVLLFEQNHPGHFKPILDWPDNALATTSTHDLPTLDGWWRARDIDWNHRLHLIDERTEKDWRQTRHHERMGLRHTLAHNGQHFTDSEEQSDQVIDASIRFIGHTRAPLVLLPLEDALGIEEQPNLPGTLDEHPNWRRRLAGEAGEVLDDTDAARRLEILARARQQAHERDR